RESTSPASVSLDAELIHATIFHLRVLKKTLAFFKSAMETLCGCKASGCSFLRRPFFIGKI
ncbi:MAG: hypothetical protein ACRC5C_14985, partial [Bacilli bacterium]